MRTEVKNRLSYMLEEHLFHTVENDWIKGLLAGNFDSLNDRWGEGKHGNLANQEMYILADQTLKENR